MKIVTGFKSENHITSADWQALNQGIVGAGNHIFDRGVGFAATMPAVTTVEIGEGDGLMQGVHFRVEPGTVDTVEVAEGEVGMNRYDLITARYTKDPLTGKEDVAWHVIEGTPTSGEAEIPEYIEGDILAGDLVADFPIHMVRFEGLTSTLFWAPGVEEFPLYRNLSAVEIGLSEVAGRLGNFGNAGQYENDATISSSGSTVTIFSDLAPGVYVGSFLVIETADRKIDGYVAIENSLGNESQIGLYGENSKWISGAGLFFADAALKYIRATLRPNGTGTREVSIIAYLYRLE